jgi:O-antigen/teichoic acid export membrane protein
LFSSAAFLIANTATGSLFGFLFWFLAARLYSPAEVGIGAAYISAVTFLTNLGEMGLGTALIRFAPRMEGQRVAFINTTLVVVAGSTLLAATVFAIGTPLWSPELEELRHSTAHLSLFLVSALAFGLAQMFDRLFVAFETTQLMFARNIVANIARIVIVVTVGRALGASGLLLAVGGSAVLALILASGAFAPRALPDYRPRLSFAWSLLRDKAGYTLGNHFSLLFWNAPPLIYPLVIVELLGAEANARFYISWMVANLLFVVPTAVSTSAFARAANQAVVDDRQFWRAMWRTLLGIAPVAAVIIVPAQFLLRAFGAEYAAAGSTVFLCLVGSILPYSVNTFVIAYHRIHQHTGRVLWVSGAITLVCVVLSIGLGVRMGLAGIGLGWLGGQTVGMVIGLLSYCASGFRKDGLRAMTTVLASIKHYIAHWSAYLFWVYLLLVTLAELITSVFNPQAGLVLHALLLVGLLAHGALASRENERRLALALTLAPMIRLLSLSLPLARVPQSAWYPFVSIPLLLASWIIIRQVRVSREALGLRPGNLALQMMLVGGGLGLGALEYMILQPRQIVGDFSWSAVWLPALSLVIFTGFNEELIFRGLLQAMTLPVFGRWAIAYVALLFAVLHIGYLSVLDVVFVFAVGLLFAYVVRWGGSILGVTLAHGLTNITLFIVMPYLDANRTGLLFALAPWLFAGSTAAAIFAIYMLVPRKPAAQPAANPGVMTPSELRQIRRDARVTFIELAEQTGLPVRLLAEIEYGMRVPAAEELQVLAQAYGSLAGSAA